ncbi:hypothetical protein ACOSQ2_026425 [Xanthoceras sorbifolium]
MASSRADKGKAPMGAKRTCRVLSKSSRGAAIPEEFLKASPLKRTRTSVERYDSHHPEEVVAEDVRPLKVKPPRFRKVSPHLGSGEHGDPSHSEERTSGDNASRPPPMHTPRRTSTEQTGSGGPFFPENSVDFMCSYARNFMKFSDGGVAGKLSNDDKARIVAGQLWTCNQEMRLLQLNQGLQKMESRMVIKKNMCSSLERKLGEAKSEITSLRAQLASSEALAEARKAAAGKGAKATEYKEWLRKAHALVKRLQRELPERAIDRWVRSSEHTKAIDEEFERGATDTEYLVSRVDPNFDFVNLEEIRAEEWARGGATYDAGEPAVEENCNTP